MARDQHLGGVFFPDVRLLNNFRIKASDFRVFLYAIAGTLGQQISHLALYPRDLGRPKDWIGLGAWDSLTDVRISTH